MKDSDAFDQLGIEPTTDEAAIRRAYAARLKQVRGDEDRDAFMQLRQAYDDAMEDARAALVEDDALKGSAVAEAEFRLQEESERRDPVWPSAGDSAVRDSAVREDLPVEDSRGSRPPPSFEAIKETELTAFRTAFETSLSQRDSGTAARLLSGALASGLVKIGQESVLLSKVVDVALADRCATADGLAQIAGRFGEGQGAPGVDQLPGSMHRLLERIAAMRWFAQLEANARKGGSWPGRLIVRRFRRRSRVAAAILGCSTRGLRASDLAALRTETETSLRYGPWLDGRVEPERLAKNLTAFERYLAANLWKVMSFGLLLGLSNLLAREPHGEVAAFGAVGVALIVVGNWMLTMLGILLLALAAWSLTGYMGG